MSSAETLNFGPQWLRDLSEGSGNSASTTPPSQSTSVAKFKLAENRYGREEMLALFVEESELPDELQRAPSLASEIVQIPLAFRPTSEHSQAQLPISYRGRGLPSGLRGRSIPSRGRGRGRGSAWADHDDGPQRRPPLVRRSESEHHWRNDSRGKGDGAEDVIGGLKEWRLAGQRADFWKDAWRERPDDAKEQRPPRGRALSSRDAEYSGARWREDDDADVFLSKPKTLSTKDPPNQTKQSTRQDDDSPHEKEPPINEGAEPQTQQTAEVPIENRKPPTEVFAGSNGLERRASLLDSVPEARNPLETEEDKKQSTMMPQNGNSSVNGNAKSNLEKMFHNLTTSEQGIKKTSEPVLIREAQTLEDVTAVVSLTSASSQSLPFSSNSSLRDAPVSADSPITRLQALASTWYYKDPQGEVQGPFSANQMMEWFNAGYFTMVLLVKRGCDADFAPLGELIKTWGHIPFISQSNALFPTTQASANASLLIQQQQQQQQQQQIAYNMKLMEGQQSQTLPQQVPQSTVARTYQQQQQADFDAVVSKLMQHPDFCRMSTQQQRHVLLQYMDELKRKALAAGVSFQPTLSNDVLSAVGSRPNELPQTPSALYQQKLLEEARRKEKEEEMLRLQKQQEEQKEFLRQQEEEFRRKKEMLMREEEQIKRLQLEAQRKKEELQRTIEEDEKLKKMQEMERRRKREEEEGRRMREEFERREAEQRRIYEEEQSRKEQQRKEEEEEEEARRRAEMKMEEIRMENEREEQRIQEEKRKREERQAVMEAEMQRKADAARIQREKEAEAKALLKKQQQEKQMQQIQLPSHARWGQGSQPTQHAKNDSLSLLEIQQLEKREEQTRQKEEGARIARDARSQAPKTKSGWGATAQEDYGVSLLDIQREEAKQMSITKQAAKPEKVTNVSFNTSWSKPPKIQPDPPKPPSQRQQQPQASFWDQVVEESPQQNPIPALQSQAKQQTKPAKQKPKSDEGQQIKALFQQQIAKDSFTDWCEGYLRKMNAGSIDIPTFVNFLRDVDSPYEVQEYVQSYLGESREAKDFTTLFLEQRAKLGGTQRQQQTSQNKIPGKSKGSRDTDGFEVVRSSAKRGKKKFKKTTQVDPNILGFSVNAASDRVNMGEIQTADD